MSEQEFDRDVVVIGAGAAGLFAATEAALLGKRVLLLEKMKKAGVKILASGGSLSHHHGVGKLRQHHLPEIFSEAALAWRRELKRAVDPDDVFGCGN